MGISCYRVKGILHAPWRSGRRTRFCGKTYGSSAQCSGSSGKIVCSLPRSPTMSVRTVCWEAGRYPKARWSESWRQEIGTSIGSISLSATTRENAMPCYSNGGRRSLRYCISRNRFQWHLSSGYSKNLNAIVSNKTITFVISNLEIKWKIFNISYRKKKSI